MQEADRILVMKAGRIVDEGSHEALLAGSVLYRQLSRALAIAPRDHALTA